VTASGPRHLAVARLRKPHGLKGDVVLFPLTDDPATVLAAGRRVWLMDLAGGIIGGPLEIEHSRSYHREWLVKFAGIESRDALEPLRAHFLAAPADELSGPSGDEVYLHELEGFAVRLEDGTPVGVVSSLYEMPAGLMIEVQGPRREFLLPYKREFVREVDRSGRTLAVRLPEGLLDA
jgi:16S rRNA processing protein RimM